MNDSTVINFDYNSITIPQDLEQQLHLTTLLLRETLKKQKNTALGDLYTIRLSFYTFPITQNMEYDGSRKVRKTKRF